ncbi:L,D-transpeptidase [Corynebacterium testudinoris]|uniref:L,D-TPase catalytic domain-containing protein n=1 Tax=Corynebacterium testudinoris TaxID=136857 RepID=A0A0G3H9T5_9CORY|nr:hypothetical protein CTEST_10570 [Corynebacterium testudinoris]MBX8996220.1 L,D-transpeptidase [Corynebacterium testudinoris]
MSAVRRVAVLTAVTMCAAVGLAACTLDRQQGAEGEASISEPEAKLAPTMSVKDGTKKYDPATPVTVESQDEGLASVEMVNEDGKVIQSKLSEDTKSWTTDEVLGYNRTYTVTAKDKNGETTKSTFATATPTSVASVALSPLDGSTVGVAQTIAFRFSQAIPDRQAAQDAISITTEPKVDGQFFWLNNQEVRWRPEQYWTPGTSVAVKADIYGQELGDGVYGDSNNAAKFTIGDEVMTVVDDATKTMTVTKNGEVLRSIPVSLGADRWPTPNGTYIIGDSHSQLLMDSETFGLSHDSGGYKTMVDYATQMSYSGIYVHAAPWSVGQQGYSNVSHGCINVTTEAANWFQNTVKRGDPVVVKNTIAGTLSGYDGLGDWNIPWETWKKGNVNETSSW